MAALHYIAETLVRHQHALKVLGLFFLSLFVRIYLLTFSVSLFLFRIALRVTVSLVTQSVSMDNKYSISYMTWVSSFKKYIVSKLELI